MSNQLNSYAHLSRQLARAGWFVGVRRMTERIVSSYKAKPPPVHIKKKVPSGWVLLRDVGKFLLKDAQLVKSGIYVPQRNAPGTYGRHLAVVRKMLKDLPSVNERRVRQQGTEVSTKDHVSNFPDYYLHNFHFQTGGYLTEESAELYDIQVETLFMGTADAMRRQALIPIAEYIFGKQQRDLSLVDVACGTGRFIEDIKRAFTCLPVTGIDLSPYYIDEARKTLEGRRAVNFLVANAENMPLHSESQDIATCIYLFHELPASARVSVAKEICRVLKPGGILIFIDSLQFADQENYDGLLEAFPQRFHEPYYAEYLSYDLKELFTSTGLTIRNQWNAFLSKVIVLEKV